MNLNLKEIKEIKLLENNPVKEKKISDKSKYNEFVQKNENNFNILKLIYSIKKISKTWYLYEKLRVQICEWNELDLNWVIKIKEILDQNSSFLTLNLKEFYSFIQLKKQVEKETRISTLPEKEITCTEIIFERVDDYEILF